MDTVHQRLIGTKERVFRLHKAQRRKEELQKRLREQERLIMQHELKLEDEEADVSKLMRMSLTTLFYTVLRSKDEQLKKERQEVLTAALKLQEARQLHSDTESDLQQANNDISYYRNAPREYDELMEEKEALLRTSPTFTYELAELDESVASKAVQAKELQEACSAGRRVLSALEDASAALAKAQSWGNWDLWGGGGMLSTHIKHNHIDDARSYIHNANHLMASFQDELADVNRTAAIRIDVSATLKMADYWFDGLIADWVVQGHIKNASERVSEALGHVRGILAALDTELAAVQTDLEGLRTKRISWIEGRELA
ncbi:hypothetical protein FHS18_005070 [Paenibacillus phyllosphaerae]|uniref:Uncharacterized protein n=1 Tax=Paenibacillus phyllosphaerae TaxID=274593 RepID=A0A7W5B202_9BACL|nr:hypothetical protein [Paenibacillus phyllosphaerae]MBB3112968.1 hypothetical protein [Paenibacillus phyllosphaerae]